MKKIFTFLLLLCSSMILWGQNYDTSIPVMSPEIASLGKFGAYPVSYYTGTPDINIPLYQLKVHNIEIPITLQYDASGFMPNKDSGKVGHDWTLCAGGVITRSVNLIPDEWQADLLDPEDYTAQGHWYAIHGLNRKLNEDSVRTLKYITTSAANGINFETTPDMFTFNFGKYHGQFIIAHDGTPKVISDGNYRIDLQNFAIQRLNSFTANSSIVITTDDGTKYTFGGTPDALEISLRMRKEYGNIQDYTYNGVINGFYLSKIETTDGETIEFSYRQYANTNNKYIDDDNIVKNRYYADAICSPYGYANTTWLSNGTSPDPQYTFTKIAYLSTIHSSAGTVTFNYVTKEQSFCHGVAYWHKNTLRLDNILITDNHGNDIKGIKFYQTFFASKDTNSYRMFLTDILCGKEKYSFTYTDQNNLPAADTRGVDLHGYYNGNDTNSTLLPLHYGNDPDEVDFSHRQPNFTYASKGMLKRITYPTGGYTEFTFENHQYGTIIHKFFDYRYPLNLEQNGLVGGLRIKQIKNVPGETRTFEYETEGENNTIPSGVFNDLKRYAFLSYFGNYFGWNITTWAIAEGNNIVHAHSFSESDIVYSRVTETYGTNNGKKVYNYSTYLDYPDLPTLGDDTYSYYKESNVTDEAAKLLKCMVAYTSQQIKRGKLLSLSEYINDDAMPERETIYSYRTNGTEEEQAVYAAEVRLLIHRIYGICNSQAFYYYPYQLVNKEVREYSGAQYVSNLTNYSYNTQNKLPQEISTTNSDGTIHRTEYTYPVNFSAISPYNTMVQMFMVSPVISEKHYRGNTLIKTLRNNYQLYQNKFYARSSIEQAFGNNPFQTLVTFHDYDKRQNILSLTEIGKPTVSYIWGYNYQYPLAKLVNFPLSSVRNVLSTSTQERIAEANELSDTDSLQLDNLFGQFPSAHITTYNYKPLVGMTFMKGPNKLRHHYTYDAWGRLQNVFTEGQKVKEVTYNHIYTASAPLSTSFSDLSSSYSQGTQTFSMNTSGGSGAYVYEWSLKNSAGTLLSSSTSATLSYNLTASGSYTLSCTVTDKITQERISKSRTFTVAAYQIQFSNISRTSEFYQGNATTTAIITCKRPTTIEFYIEHQVGQDIDTSHFECRIGNYFYSGIGKGEKTFTVTLQKGQNVVSLKLLNILYTDGTASLYIRNVTTPGSQVGPTNALDVYFF